ncbi:unnamed protein product [Rotaria magnacalcarata]|uniref:Uncharacterized protein n=1 Tax=Rotaria magnacalcarata TaxID=392030 RepID=A0A819EKX0_9BILA|nr:unnamed protein product [Rotaria magnacalcarata]
MIYKAVVVVFLTLILASVECKFGICSDNETLDLESDGYQYIRSKDPLISALYREWWFFALYDPLVDIGFCIGYSAMDPAKTFGLEASGIAGMLWTSVANNTGQDPINVLDGYDFEQFSAYKENATVSIGKENFIKVLDQTTYQIIGSSRNSELNWSLTFQQKSYACRQKEEVPQVLELDWITYMPSAHVFGVIQYNTKLFSINTTAYHDHNYGAWPTNLFNWIWAQFHRVDKEFSLVLGKINALRLEHCGNTFHLKPLEWQIVDGKKYSIHNKIEAWNDQYKINIEYKARVSNDNPGGRGLGLKVFEQISQYEVILYGKHEDNWVILEQNLTGYGFSEWSHVEI